MNWQARRSDSYNPPLTRGMRRRQPKERSRSRTLTDPELRAIWKAAERDGGLFGGFIRLCLLTAQRSRKLASAKWSDLDFDAGVWTIARESPREKDTGGELRLSPLALAIFRGLPRFADCPYVFPGNNAVPMDGFSQRKRRFDAKVAKEFGASVPPWVLHDLRRTSRSLLSRAHVRPEVAERILGHAVGGAVAQIYDRYDFNREKADALLRLTQLIERIVSEPAGGNVIPMERA
jgi:integrase